MPAKKEVLTVNDLTLKDRLIYLYIKERADRGENPPTDREIIFHLQEINKRFEACDDLGFTYERIPAGNSTSSIYYSLNKLIRLNWLQKDFRKARGIEIVEDENRIVPVPIFKFKDKISY